MRLFGFLDPVESVNSINSVNSVNFVNSVNSVNSVNFIGLISYISLVIFLDSSWSSKIWKSYSLCTIAYLSMLTLEMTSNPASTDTDLHAANR